MCNIVRSIPSDALPVLASNFANGNSIQQSFSAVRTKGFNLTYQQVSAYHNNQTSAFNNAFASIFSNQ